MKLGYSVSRIPSSSQEVVGKCVVLSIPEKPVTRKSDEFTQLDSGLEIELGLHVRSFRYACRNLHVVGHGVGREETLLNDMLVGPLPPFFSRCLSPDFFRLVS